MRMSKGVKGQRNKGAKEQSYFVPQCLCALVPFAWTQLMGVFVVCGALLFLGAIALGASENVPQDLTSAIRTPKPPATPRINGPSIFGVRPGSPFLYRIPATGDRPMTFSAEALPAGLRVDSKTGQISGSLKEPGEHNVTFIAKNALGTSEKKFRIVVGGTISLTPPLGWNSWNCWARSIDAEKVRAAAKAMVDFDLINHGWSYINIDDAWQGVRGGKYTAIQGNEKFPDMKALCDEVHGLGLKIGIYSTPWTTSYAGFIGGSSNEPNGAWSKGMGRGFGQYPFAWNDARQWADWGIDYLKYDWNPLDVPHVRQMSDALRFCGRDIVYSLSNSAPFALADEWAVYANCWRTSGDIRDNWSSVARIMSGWERWYPYGGPGHWNDPDMLVVGYVGWGPKLHPTNLTADEQYTHISFWCLVGSPMLLGCDLSRLDAFTINLLTNDEVLDVSQDALGDQPTKVSEVENADDPGSEVFTDSKGRKTELRKCLYVMAKSMEDDSKVAGLFNNSTKPATVTLNWSDLGIKGNWRARDLWRQKDLGQFGDQFQMTVAPHGAELVRIWPVQAN